LLTLDADLTESLGHFGLRRKDSFFPPRDLDWQLVRSDESVLNAAVQFGAVSYGHFQSSSEDAISYADKRRAVTIQVLRKRLEKDQLRPSDTLILTLIGILAAETHLHSSRLPDDRAESNINMHIRGLRAMLQCRSDWDLACYHPALQWELPW
jgi:hypothetical protein